MDKEESILVVRLGAMGDVLHALPAVASLKQSFPGKSIVWVVAPKWIPLLRQNPSIDRIIPFHRGGLDNLRSSWQALRALSPASAVDFQGLIQSATIGRIARPGEFFGFDKTVAREPVASLFYSRRIRVEGPHRIDRNLQLVSAMGAERLTRETWLPPGREEGELPTGPFVLASPFAGWAGKQWPVDRYRELAAVLHRDGLRLVVNLSEAHAATWPDMPGVSVHTSSIEGLIHATRRATAVVGLDSGPLHLAAALNKAGVGVFGPTNPACTGPYGATMIVLRAEGVPTTYDRHERIQESMEAISAKSVHRALLQSIAMQSVAVASGK